MDFLRKAAKTWAAKLLLILLVASFGVWGISGSLFYGNSTTVVSVGDETVGPEIFHLMYQQRVGVESQRFGRRLTSEEARALGIEEQVFSSLATQAALTEQAEALNLGISIETQDRITAETPMFRDAVSGDFSLATFRRTLLNFGLTESQFHAWSEKASKREQLIEALSDGYEVPQTLVAALAEYRAETRDVDFITVNTDQIDPVAAPTDDELATYFEDNLSTYAAPEFRKVSYVKLEAEDILNPDDITEDSIVAEFESRRSSYSSDETRTIDQLSFIDKAAADAALDKLNSGLSFDALASQEGKTASDIAIGTLTKAAYPDQSLADAAFAIEEQGGTSGVVQGTFGPVILRVSTIVPAVTRTLDDVRDQIKQDLALIEATNSLFDVHDGYEDDRASGLTIHEAAAKQKLEVTTIEKLDQFGRDDNGDPIADIPQAGQLISEAFQSEIGIENSPLNIGNEGFVWYEVEDILPARDRTLDEVKDRLAADWIETETENALSAKASELKERLEKGALLTALSDELGVELGKKIGIKRSDFDDIFGRAALETAFAGPEGHTGIAAAASGDSQIILKVVSVDIPDGAATDSANIPDIETIHADASSELMLQFVSQLQNEYGVFINRELAARILNPALGGAAHY